MLSRMSYVIKRDSHLYKLKTNAVRRWRYGREGGQERNYSTVAGRRVRKVVRDDPGTFTKRQPIGCLRICRGGDRSLLPNSSPLPASFDGALKEEGGLSGQKRKTLADGGV
ncbi:hypothetical protein J437_LFUL002388 [Ladona fulva]|uniref:Uncharacterized protein n=1 Tax=Ladona fulva TaxID=123851 RepID=A0A8K0K381_LADFU|nr:hypothetical protein J437_LFUL002388 [Ladona fulva]